MAETAAIFIDSGYIDKVLKKEFDGVKIDYDEAVKEFIKQAKSHDDERIDLFRAYYYDCPPYQSSDPTQEEKERYANKQKFFNALESYPRFEVRTGKLVKRSEGGFQQKRVDVMFATDMVMLALKGDISYVIVVTGDQDIIPALEAIKGEGILLHLFHGDRGAYHQRLWEIADERTQISQDIINRIKLNR